MIGQIFSEAYPTSIEFLKQTANKLSKADNLRVFVMTNVSGALIGFYSANASELRYENLPPRYASTRPRHGTIESAHISMMGMDSRFAELGYGGDLLVDALQRIETASSQIGISLIFLDVLDCGDQTLGERRTAFYESYGFRPTASCGLKLFMPIASVGSMRFDAQEE